MSRPGFIAVAAGVAGGLALAIVAAVRIADRTLRAILFALRYRPGRDSRRTLRATSRGRLERHNASRDPGGLSFSDWICVARSVASQRGATPNVLREPRLRVAQTPTRSRRPGCAAGSAWPSAAAPKIARELSHPVRPNGALAITASIHGHSFESARPKLRPVYGSWSAPAILSVPRPLVVAEPVKRTRSRLSRNLSS
jgi:hypothetical protein